MPRPKPNMTDLLNEYFLFKNVEINIPSKSEFNCNTLIEIKCKNNLNHIYKVSITQIRRNQKDITICPHCEKEQKYIEMGIPKQLIIDYCDKFNLDYEPKKEFYNRWDDSLTFICKNDLNKIVIKSLGYFEKTQQKIECQICKIRSIGILTEAEYLNKIEKIKIENGVTFNIPHPSINKVITPSCLNKIQKLNWSIIEFNGTRVKSKFKCNDCGYEVETLINNLNKCLGCSKLKNKKQVCEKLKNICKENRIFIPDTDIYYNTTESLINFKCNDCGHDFNFSWSQITGKYYKLVCPKCYKSIKRGKENEVYDFVQSIYLDIVIQNDKTVISPKELDIFIPNKNLAIEFCGNIWHSEKYISDKNYHNDKLLKCLEKNVKLLTIFEDEWDDKNEICKSKIKNSLGICDYKVFARKCEIKMVNKYDSHVFCETNHLQGYCKQTTISYGLYYKNELISIMCFNNAIKTRKADFELNRFCNKLNCSIPGAFSKLLTHFRRFNRTKTLISYSDNRWGSGDVYLKNGFSLISCIPIRYFYVGNITLWKRKHRFTFNKYRLKKLFKLENGSESEITKTNEIYKLWDCGYKKWKINC